MKYLTVLAMMLLVLLAACAPDNLDITPTLNAQQSLPPTAVPTNAAVSENNTAKRVIVDQLIAAIPTSIPAGSINWRKTSDPTEYVDQTGGATGRIKFTGVGGGALELTLAAFDTPESAQTYYASVIARTRNLENGKPRDQFPQPNLFGVSTYGSAAIFIQGKIVVFASVPQFPSTAGEPLGSLSRQLFAALGDLIISLNT